MLFSQRISVFPLKYAFFPIRNIAMRLTHIKLSGFKSFTDPTTIHVPGQLVAVIGPNGCGKSNVIDAVRWVLGEASAKQLRGESMQDVIFNGAATRVLRRGLRWSWCLTIATTVCRGRGGSMPR